MICLIALEIRKNLEKKIGGDILEKKKTLLYVYTSQNLSKNHREEFEKLFNSDEIDEELKINSIKTFYIDSGAVELVKQKVKEYSNIAREKVDELELDMSKKNEILNFSKNLLDRQI